MSPTIFFGDAKRHAFPVLILIILAIVCSSSAFAQKRTEKLLIATFQSAFPPLVWYEQYGEYFEAFGAEPDILKEISTRTGIQYELVRMPFNRIKLSLEDGSLDASLGGWKLPEREVYGIYMDRPMVYDFFKIYVVEGKEFKFETVEDLFDKEVGKIRGVNVYPDLDQAVATGKMDVIEVGNRPHLIEMLRQGRLDAMMSSTLVTGYELKSLGITDVVALPKRLTQPQGTYIWFSKKAGVAPHVIDQFNKAMESMHHDGTIRRILKKYGILQNL